MEVAEERAVRREEDEYGNGDGVRRSCEQVVSAQRVRAPGSHSTAEREQHEPTHLYRSWCWARVVGRGRQGDPRKLQLAEDHELPETSVDHAFLGTVDGLGVTVLVARERHTNDMRRGSEETDDGRVCRSPVDRVLREMGMDQSDIVVKTGEEVAVNAVKTTTLWAPGRWWKRSAKRRRGARVPTTAWPSRRHSLWRPSAQGHEDLGKAGGSQTRRTARNYQVRGVLPCVGTVARYRRTARRPTAG